MYQNFVLFTFLEKKEKGKTDATESITGNYCRQRGERDVSKKASSSYVAADHASANEATSSAFHSRVGIRLETIPRSLGASKEDPLRLLRVRHRA